MPETATPEEANHTIFTGFVSSGFFDRAKAGR
jgi:hypothetical protein